MNCPVCLTNLTEEVKYASSVDDYAFYVFCPDCGNIIGLSTTSLKLEQVDGLVGNSDAARSYITNDRYKEDVSETLVVDEEPEEEVVPLLQLELEAMEEQEPKQEPIEDDRVREVPEDIQHQIDAVGFGDYLIIINDYKEADFELFTGTREELNAHLEALNLHNAPKVYTLKQLHVKTTYSV